MQHQPIGVFDSGVGGISVLRTLCAVLPDEQFIYYGDSLNAPYGIKSEPEIRRLALKTAQTLLAQSIKALVIACNTATSAAVDDLRARFDLPIIGIEPALKPAAARHQDAKILVMATPATLRQNKFGALMEQYGRNAQLLPCPGLMEFAERGEIASPALDAYLADRFAPWKNAGIGAIVLGCTHYVFLRGAIQKAMPGAQLFDGNLGTARRLENVLREADLLRPAGPGGVVFQTSGDPEKYLPVFRMLYALRC
jgi:glutamate racemase